MDFKQSNFRRNNDLEEVFNQRYKANHGNNERVQREIKDFNYKMYGIKDKDDTRKMMRDANSVKGQIDRLNKNINAVNNFNRNNW